MDMLRSERIAEAQLTEWRKLAQGLHARYVVDDFASAARFVVAVGQAGDELGHHPKVSIGLLRSSTVTRCAGFCCFMSRAKERPAGPPPMQRMFMPK